MNAVKQWALWGVITVATVALGVFVLARTPFAPLFGLIQKRPGDVFPLRSVK